MLAFRLLLGLLLTFLGLGYLFHPGVMLRLNAFMREVVFKDTHILLNNRRIGGYLLLLGILLLIFTFGAPR